MKEVSLLAPPDVVAKSMRDAYAGLVAPAVIEAWAKSPRDAPGRLTSSPWPDRIEVRESSGTGTVKGTLVEVTSGGEAARTPIEIRLRRSGSSWLITEYRRDEREAAVTVIREYYAAIAARDFARAFRSWGTAGPPGQSVEEFAKGFADTADVQVETGEPSRVEPAAGSQYVDVPVTIVGKTKTGQRQRFEGSYTLRRSVVDGAAEADRQWHIDRASIHRSSP